jgi:hypothetical protein
LLEAALARARRNSSGFFRGQEAFTKAEMGCFRAGLFRGKSLNRLVRAEGIESTLKGKFNNLQGSLSIRMTFLA